MELEPVWYQYATFDEDGFVNGISENAPDSAKIAFSEYVNQIEDAKKKNQPIER